MFKNVATKIALFAFDTTTGAAKTGDAANITAYVSKDFGSVTQLTDTSATEMDATNAKGWYLFDVTQTEADADFLLFTGKSATANVSIVGRPIDTTPNRFTSLVIDAAGLADANMVKAGPSGSGTAQTAGDIIGDTNDIQARLPAALVGGRMDASVGAVANDAITASAIATDAIGAIELAAGAASEIASAVRTELTTELGRIDVAVSTRASQTSVDTIDDFVDTEIAAIKAVTDKLDNTVENTSDGWIFTVNALQNAPSGTGASPEAIADEVQTRTIAAVTTVNGLAANSVTAAALAADAVSEIQSGLATAAALTTVEGKIDTIDDYIDTEVSAINLRGERTVVRGTAAGGASTTSIPTSAFSPAGAAADQFKGRIVVFDNDTATAALRGQATDITASSNSATPTLTVTALTTAPSSGDTFSVL